MRKKKPSTRRSRTTPKLQMESLEIRLPLAVTPGITLVKGVLTITGSEADDIAEVNQPSKNTVTVSLTGVDSKSYKASNVKSIVFNGLGGDDTFINNTAVKSKAEGGAGEDTLRGGRGADDLQGGDDNDRIFGNAGNDSVSGGGGDDTVHGDDGNDRVVGDGGDDDIYGGRGKDVLRGGGGNDDLYGEDQNDDLDGEDDDDLLNGGTGKDRIRGGRGLDREDDSTDSFEDGDDDGDGYDDDHKGPVDASVAETVNFLPADAAAETDQTAQLTGESLNERDRKYFKFVAPAGKSALTITVLPDGNGNYAEVELKAAATNVHLLDVEPMDNGITSGQAAIVPGTLYILRVRSPFDHAAVGFTVDLKLDNSTVSPIVGNEISFDTLGFAALTGSLTGEAKQVYSFTAASSGTLTTTIMPVNGRYAKVKVKNRAADQEVLELEPYSRGGKKSGSFAVVAGQTYTFEVESNFETMTIDYLVNLQLS